MHVDKAKLSNLNNINKNPILSMGVENNKTAALLFIPHNPICNVLHAGDEAMLKGNHTCYTHANYTV